MTRRRADAATVLDLARESAAAAGRPAPVTGGDFEREGFAILGGCERCAASIAAYNAFPSRSGFWRCGDCLPEGAGFRNLAVFRAWLALQAAEEEAEGRAAGVAEEGDPSPLGWEAAPGGPEAPEGEGGAARHARGEECGSVGCARCYP